MAVLAVRNLPDYVYRALRLRTAENRRSTESEMHEILAINVKVLAWLDNQIAETLYLTSVTLTGLLFGTASMQNEKRSSK